MANGKRGINRRTFLKGAGAVIILAGGSGLTWRAAQRGVFSAEDGAAYELWRQPWPSGPDNRGALGLVAAAVLAANPHNSQPWLFRIESDRIHLYADRTHKLHAIDPDERELMIGLGCALENLTLAAEARGHRTSVVLLPEGPENSLIASVALQPDEPLRNPLYDVIPQRRTNRSRYSAKPIPDGNLTALVELAEADPALSLHLFISESERRPVADLILRAAEVQAKDEAQHAETTSWFRMTPKEIQEHRDGITIDAGGNPPLMRMLAKLVISEKMIHGPTFGESFVSNTKTQVNSASAFAIISAESKSHEVGIRCGRLFQRIHLWATSHGIALQPMNYPLENRPEMMDEVAALLGSTGRVALIPFRLGYGPEVPHSPRRAVKDVIIPRS